MDIALYFEPIDNSLVEGFSPDQLKRLGDVFQSYHTPDNFPELEGVDIAIIGVKEDRAAINNAGCADAPDFVRHFLYRLFPGGYNAKIADLGNIRRGHTVEDTYFALRTVLAELLKNRVIPIIIGGSQDLTYANYQAYESLNQIINIVAIDGRFDIGESGEDLSSRSYLSRIILHKPNFLFNYTNIGYQTYFVDQEAIKLMKNLYFDVYRLGVTRENIAEMEPEMRNADMLTVDVSSIRMSDAPGNGNASPHGFYGEEMCQMMRYAGLSDKLSSVGFYELNPSLDNHGQTAHLVAQMIWYFIEGFYNRKKEYPIVDFERYVKYIVNLEDRSEELYFYKSKISDRWWMEVKCDENQKKKFERHYLVACSYKDYLTACENDIPDRWWQAYQKLM